MFVKLAQFVGAALTDSVSVVPDREREHQDLAVHDRSSR